MCSVLHAQVEFCQFDKVNATRSARLESLNAILILPYFFGYKMEFFSFQNNKKNLNLSYKMDLDLWDCLRRVKLIV